MGVAREAACLHLFLLAFASMALNGSSIGVNWGKITSRPLPDDKIVDMLIASGFKTVKLFDVDDGSMKALMGRDIEVMVAIPNKMLKKIAQNPELAAAWVQANVTKWAKPGGVNIKYVAVGNEPFLAAYNGTYVNITLPALQSVQQALDDAKLGSRIKATVPCNADVLVSPGAPSSGKFRPDITDLMTQMLKFYSQNKSPFTMNIYPFLDVYLSPGFPFDFAFFDGVNNPMQDGELTYTNVLDSSIDTLICSMEKVGYDDIPIIVGEVGWPTDGAHQATVENARRFNQGLVQHVASNEGTPKRKGKLNVYLFSLLDEDLKDIAPGTFERHWGILGSDGQPKFELDPSGRNRSTGLVGVKGVKYMAKKWCVLNPDKAGNVNLTFLGETTSYACTQSDCTLLDPGSSCEGLGVEGNASYAFNQYYQAQNQLAGACVFSGLAKLTDKDPTNGTCVFPIAFESTSPANPSALISPAPDSSVPDSSASVSPGYDSSISDSTVTHSSARMNSSSRLAAVLWGLTVFLLASAKWQRI